MTAGKFCPTLDALTAEIQKLRDSFPQPATGGEPEFYFAAKQIPNGSSEQLWNGRVGNKCYLMPTTA